MTDYTYMDLLPARKALARRLIEDYPDIEDIDELPQVLVQTFNVLTDIARLDGTPYVTYFTRWWDRRDNLLRKGWLCEER